jgi:putative transposase
VDDLVQAMGLAGISKRTVSKLCKDIDDRVGAFLDRPLTGDWPYLWLDATDLKQREGGRIVSVAAIIAVAANTEGKREIVGLHIGPSEAATFWATFLKRLARRGLHGVQLVISDAHEGLTAAIRRVMGSAWQRCRVHWMRNALSYVPKSQQSMASAALRQAFIQPDRPGASQTLRHVADQLRAKWPKLGAFIDDSETDVLAHMDFPAQHRSKIHSTNPLERPNKEVKRRADVVGSRASLSTPQRQRHYPTDRRRVAGGQRRMAAPAPLHADRTDGRAHTADDRSRAHPDSHRRGVIRDHLSYILFSTTLTDVTASFWSWVSCCH